MSRVDEYSYVVKWSEEDHGFLCRTLEMPSICCFGDTWEKAVSEMRFLMSIFVEMDSDVPVPDPSTVDEFLNL